MSTAEPPNSVRQRAAIWWPVRLLIVAAASAGAWWWSSTQNFAGARECAPRSFSTCADGTGFESMAPWFLWPITALASVGLCVAAAATAPEPRSRHLAWALAIGACVFVAHRNNLVWAAVVTGVAVWAVARATDHPSS